MAGLTISSPPNGAAIVGANTSVPVTITGTATFQRRVSNVGVAVTTDKGDLTDAQTTIEGEPEIFSYAWTARVNLRPGTTWLRVTATGEWETGDGHSGTQGLTATISLNRDITSPSLVIHPLPNPYFVSVLAGNRAAIPVAGTTNDLDGSGVQKVEVSVDGGQTYSPATPDPTTGWSNWTANLNVTIASNINTGQQITPTPAFRCLDYAGNIAPQTMAIRLQDAAPILTIQSINDYLLSASSDPQNITINMNDRDTQLLIAGTAVLPELSVQDGRVFIQGVDWTVSNPALSGKATLAHSDWRQNPDWRAPIQIRKPGDPSGSYTLTFSCSNNNKSSRAISLTIRVIVERTLLDADQLSPLMYLNDLLHFAEDLPRIKVGPGSQPSTPLTTAQLDGEFHQPFGSLIDSSNKSKALEPVHQIRLCLEVLRGHLRTQPVGPDLSKVQSAYCQAAYTTLLTQIGTSYDELRRARGYTPLQRQALAERLGLDLGTTPAALDKLRLDPSATPPPPNPLTEQNLDKLFGLRDTATTAPLAAIATPDLLTWQLARLRATWRTQDFPPGASADSPPLIDPDLLASGNFRSPSNTDPAYSLYTARQNAVQGWLDGSGGLRKQPQSLAGLDAMLQSVLKTSAAGLL